MNTKRIIFILIVVFSIAIIFVGCEGPMGPPGIDGIDGAGAPGADGADGEDAGNYLDVGAFNYEFSGDTISRGFYFQAPVNFTIQDLEVYKGISGDVQNIAVVRFVNAPEIYPSVTNDFEILYYESSLPADEKASVNIEVFIGDHIGILGTRGTSTMYMGYGPTSGYTSSIKGVPVVLARLGMQYNMNSTAPQDLWQEPSLPISIVHMRYF